ncbi:hypothetical protein BU26DRAFT_563307 [Trematosphaeria pertusa]|uniref:Heterokaryon incompatibility domain-containing protein n=1 Tax=Trematosphaeria pertusa TaxID=390896 RepID=A0A6A6IL69_9PLEO|nr:uncharacterized protein BU26DRAFT_563307 [Trematosphaeria pertusa]KAF2251365.1 hypothetical protein BU26DRAFT_563307 [Trematosphaeria pertusa]
MAAVSGGGHGYTESSCSAQELLRGYMHYHWRGTPWLCTWQDSEAVAGELKLGEHLAVAHQAAPLPIRPLSSILLTFNFWPPAIMTSTKLYSPLSRKRREIRLLRIDRRDPIPELSQPPMECTLMAATLEEPLHYVALSYTWGNLEDGTVDILVNGVRFAAQRNLADALNSLYECFQGSWLWADAVCINQKDEVEKGWQIDQMVSVYETAHMVAAWFGPSRDDSDFLLDQMAALGKKILNAGGERFLHSALDEYLTPLYWVQERFLSAIDIDDTAAPCQSNALADLLAKIVVKDDPTSTIPWTPLREFLSREWWHRIWVVQEFVVARDVIFICGNRMASYLEFQAAFWAVACCGVGMSMALQKDTHTPASLRKVRDAIMDKMPMVLNDRFRTTLLTSAWFQMTHRRRRHAAKQPLSLGVLLNRASSPEWGKGFQATKKKDFIFALKGLAADEHDLGIRWPELYADSDENVFTEVARALIIKDKSLDLLAHCTPGREDTHVHLNLPSWVPNWLNRLGKTLASAKALNVDLPSCEKFFAAGSLLPPKVMWSKDHPERLHLRGIVLGPITAVMHPAPPSIPPEEYPLTQEAIDWFRALFRFCNPEPIRYFSLGDVISTVLADQYFLTDSKWARLHSKTNASLEKSLEPFVLSDGSVEETRLDDAPTASTLDLAGRDGQKGKISAGGIAQYTGSCTPHDVVECGDTERQTDNEKTLSDLVNFLSISQAQMERRTVFTADQKHLGLGPEHLVKGDHVAIVGGAKVPFVLRPYEMSGGGTESWKLVGECYIHGVMDGEWVERQDIDKTVLSLTLV